MLETVIASKLEPMSCFPDPGTRVFPASVYLSRRPVLEVQKNSRKVA